jgi:hypothetical protein
MPQTTPAYKSKTPKGMPSTPKDLYEGAKAKVMSLGNMLGMGDEAPPRARSARTTDIELPNPATAKRKR